MARPADDLTCDIVLRDGTTVLLRPAVDDDVPALEAFFRELSPASRYQRFLGPITPSRSAIAGMIPAADTDGLCLVAVSHGHIAAVAAYYTRRHAPDRAEVAFAVSDALQGRGIGTRLLDRLAQAARARGVATFDADVRGDKLEAGDFNLGGGATQHSLFELPPQGVNLEDVERELLTQALTRAGGNQTHAGQLLGINRDQVRYRIEKFGLHKPEHGHHAHGPAS